MDERHRIARAAGIMSIATFISRILGYVRDMIFALFFGATGISDTFFAAFRIPNLLRELFAEGSMSSAFIPILTEYRQKQGEEEANRLVKITFTFIIITVGIVCVTGIIFSPVIVTVIAPGFLGSPEKFSLTVLLTRIMFPFLLFISLAALVMGALNTRKVFFKQILRHAGFKGISPLLIPATLALAVNQINIVVSNILASYLQPGSITYLFYSMRLVQFPIGIFGVAMGMAVLPTLSEHAVKGNFDKLTDDFSFALRLLFFITIPAMAGLIVLREPLVNILFQRGKFDYTATVGTAQALLFYSTGIWAVVGVRVVTVGFYSLQDTRTPVKIAVVAMLTNIVFSIILMKPLKHSGLALANALASGVNFTFLFYFLRKKLKRIDGRRILWSFVKTIFASFIMGVVGGLILYGKLWQSHGNTVDKVFYLSGTIALCIGIYFILSLILKNEEALYIMNLAKQKFK